MSLSGAVRKPIIENFDRAAAGYDTAASVQEKVAAHLAERAGAVMRAPAAILDIGCGTGFVAAGAGRLWPLAQITAIDQAPAMLRETGRKLPAAKLLAGDAAAMEFAPQFDLIFSSMALHWVADPRAALKRWRGWLRPHGYLFAALPVTGSFRQWQALCAEEGVVDGLWILPPPDFATGLAFDMIVQTQTVDYPSAWDFICRLKSIGAATPRPDYRPFSPAILRRLLARAPQPFAVSYNVLYLAIRATD